METVDAPFLFNSYNKPNMKIIVYPHELAIGGSQLNAIDLAAAIRDLGHEAIVYALPGPLEDYIASKGLRYVPAYRLRYRPAPNRIFQLARLVRSEKVDLVHAYEWPPCLDAVFGAGLFLGIPVVCTVLSMSVMSLIPRVTPLLMGTEELAEEAQLTHRSSVGVMEPPVDIDANHPANEGTDFRRIHGINPDQLLVVIVSRLAIDLKLDALVDAIDAVDLLADAWPVRLIIVGDGQAADQLRMRAAMVNQRHRREVVTLAGAALDPRPAYAAADIVLGMGYSALRGLAHGKPLIVQGERGFNVPFDESHEVIFFRQGFYGIGNGQPGGPQLAEHLVKLLADPGRRASLGARGREIVVSRYSLNAAATRIAQLYEKTIAERPRISISEAARSAWFALALEISNHLPARKRSHAMRERLRLAEAVAPKNLSDDTPV